MPYKSPQEIEDSLWKDVMEDYIKDAEFGHKAVDQTLHHYEMMRHFEALLTHISQIRQNDLKEIMEWVWEKRRTAPKNVLDAETIQERDNYFYNQAIFDFLSHLQNLTNKES